MSGGEGKKVSKRKEAYYKRILDMLEKYNKMLVITADNIGSSHMQKVRIQLRGKGILLMGKNTLMRRAMREHVEKGNKELEPLINHITGNCGLVFVEDDLAEVRKLILENKVGALAKVGSIAPCDVIIPKGNTGMDPGKTSFFQALAIPTKINRGKVEISNDVNLLANGEKVSQSAAVLLQMLGIKPFEYYLKIHTVYDNGSVFDQKILDYTDDDILKQFSAAVANLAGLGVAVGYQTIASVPANVLKSFEKILAISIATSYTFEQSKKIKELLENPEALAAMQAAAAASAPAGGGGDAGAAGEEEKKDEDEDAEEGMGGLFGDGSDSEEGGMGGLFGGSDSD